MDDRSQERAGDCACWAEEEKKEKEEKALRVERGRILILLLLPPPPPLDGGRISTLTACPHVQRRPRTHSSIHWPHWIRWIPREIASQSGRQSRGFTSGCRGGDACRASFIRQFAKRQDGGPTNHAGLKASQPHSDFCRYNIAPYRVANGPG